MTQNSWEDFFGPAPKIRARVYNTGNRAKDARKRKAEKKKDRPRVGK